MLARASLWLLDQGYHVSIIARNPGRMDQLIEQTNFKNLVTLPKHIVSAAAIVMNNDNEILLIKGPCRGWEMPGGQVEEGESLKDAAIRETKEESGIDIEYG